MGKPKKRTRGTEQEAAEEAEQAAADIGKGKSARVEEPSKEPDEGSDSDSEDYDVRGAIVLDSLILPSLLPYSRLSTRFARRSDTSA